MTNLQKYEYKNSGIEWIGKIPRHWFSKKLKFLSAFINGFSFDGNVMDINGEIPVIRIGDIQNNNIDYENSLKVKKNNHLNSYTIKKDDILIAMSGATVGKIAVVKDNNVAYINQRVGIIRSKFSKFIQYCLQTDSFMKYINLLSFGSAQPNISMGNIINFSIPLFPLEEQQQIIDYLDKKCDNINSIIEKTKKQIELLKEYKLSIITETVTKGLDKSIELKNSGIDWMGKIPKYWKTSKIKYYSLLFNGDRGKEYPSGNDIIDTGISFINSENIHGFYLDITNCKCISEFKYKKLGGAKIQKNDIIFCLRGSVGLCSINKSISEGTIASSLVSIRANKIVPDFLNYYLHSNFTYCQTILYQNGSCAANLSAENVANYYLIVPPLLEQQKIVDFLDKKCSQIDETIEKKEELIEKLTEYKKSLIYECVTGKKQIV